MAHSLMRPSLEEWLNKFEPLAPLALSIHGATLLLLRDAAPWQWAAVVSMGLLGIWGLSGWRTFKQAVVLRATFIFVVTWLLLLTTGGVGSFFLLWYFVLLAIYPFLLAKRPALVLLIGAPLSYLLLLPISTQPIPLIVAFSQVFLLTFTGGLMLVLASTLYRFIAKYRQAEKTLRESERRYSAIFDKSPFAIALTKMPEGTTVSVNDAFLKLFEVTQAEVVGKTSVDLGISDPDSRAQVAAELQKQGRVRYFEVTRTTQSGARRVLSLNLDWVSIGEEKYVLTMINDITERKQAKEALRESEERYRSTLDNMLEGFQIIGFDWRYHYVNNSVAVQGKQTKEALLGRTMMEIYPGIEQTPLFSVLRRCMDERVAAQMENEFVFPDGSKGWFELSIQPAPEGIFILSFDISQRKQAEEALERREQHFRSLIENALDIITVLDSDGTIHYQSAAIERVLGYKPEELVGQNVFEFIHPDDLPAVMTTITEGSQIAGPTLPIEARFRHEDGSWRVLEAIGHNLLDDPVVMGIVVNARDITERKQLEGQLLQAQKMEAIGQLTAGIAHDFNNLLLVMNGFAELMKLGLPSADPHQESLDKILDAGRRAANLVRQLLVFSRQQVIEPQVLNLNTTVAELDKMLRRIISENIKLNISLSPDLGRVKVDPIQIEQIIINLAVNARDAMPEGGSLTIETANVLLDQDYVAHHLEAQPGEHILLAVSDTGHGMSEEMQAHIFEPFFTTKEPGKGTGLGLATVYGIVKQNGGNIWIYSEPGIGTTFKIYLPRAEEETSSSQIEVEAAMPTGTETILLVEDDISVRDLVRRVLQSQGYTLLEAEEGQEALRLVTHYSGPVHLLLTDVIMPGLNGWQLAEEMVQLQPDLKTLFMSGYTDNVIAHHGVLKPGISLLQKPFSSVALARKVRNVLDS